MCVFSDRNRSGRAEKWTREGGKALASSMWPKSFLTSSPRTWLPITGGRSANTPSTFATLAPLCLICTAWQFLGE